MKENNTGEGNNPEQDISKMQNLIIAMYEDTPTPSPERLSAEAILRSAYAQIFPEAIFDMYIIKSYMPIVLTAMNKYADQEINEYSRNLKNAADINSRLQSQLEAKDKEIARLTAELDSLSSL